MKKNKRNLRRKESIVNRIVNPHPVLKWDSPKKLPVDLTKIVISKFAFYKLFPILLLC